VLGGVQDHRAPATAHVEQLLPGRQPQLAAHQIELVGLRVVHRVAGASRRPGEVAAGIGHVLIEQQMVEVVAQVVVVADRGLVAGLAVQQAF